MMVAIGVDTHRASLSACAVDEAGRPVAERSFANSPSGHCAFMRWLMALPSPRRVGVEGSGSLGAALSGCLLGAEEEVREAGLPQVRGPNDYRELKLLVDYRDQLLAEQTRVRNRLHSDLQVLVSSHQGHVGELIRGSGIAAARQLLAGRRDIAVDHAEMRLVRLEVLAAEIAASKLRIEGLVADRHPALTSICGVGALTAARLLGETGDPGRFRPAAALAMARGAAPIPASSGKT